MEYLLLFTKKAKKQKPFFIFLYKHYYIKKHRQRLSYCF
nr:MAG TPA: hypothetical protein [Caudoviricetes sp.]